MKILLALCFLPSIVFASPKNLAFYLEEKPGGCRGKLLDVDSGATRTFFDHAMACPEAIKWDASAKALYFQVENKFYSMPWKPNSTANLVATFDHRKPHPKGTFLVGDFWFSAETGKLRHGYLAPLSSVKEKGKEKYEVGFEGRTITTDRFLGIGMPYMAVMVEQRDGKWVRIAQTPTTAEAGDTLGFAALSKYGDEKPQIVRLREKRWCDSECMEKKYDKATLKAQEAALKQLTPEGAEFYFDEKGNAMVAAEVMGDSVHTSPPLLFCKDKNCTTFAKVEEPLHEQLYVAPRDGWVLVGYEYGGTPKTYFFKFPSTKPARVLAEARDATWFPYGELWDSLK